MSPRFPPIAVCALGAALNSVGCGYIGVELLGLDAGPHAQVDAGAPPRDASSLDADTMDAGHHGGKPDAAASPEAGQDGAAPVALDASNGDAGADASVLHDAGAPDAFVDAGPSPCDFSGTWATKIDFAVTWGGNVGINGGSGTGYIWVRHQSNANGSIVPGTMVACGLSLPGLSFTAFSGGGTGRLNFFGVPMFDNAPPVMSTVPVIQVQGAGFPGDAMTLSPTAMVLGTTMADPLNGAWPSVTQLVSTDPDGDGKPGLTVPHMNGGGYVYLPVEPFGTSRSDAGYYALRVSLSASGSLVSCTEAMGQAQGSFDHHLLGCHRTDGAQCSSSEVDLLESDRPIYVPGAGTFQLIKVANNASCAVVRSTLP